MANNLFDKGREGFLGSASVAAIHWLNDTMSFFLLDNTYTANFTSHGNLNDVTAGARRSGPVTIANKTSTGGAADGDDIRFNSVTGAQVVAILGYKNTGTESTSTLILWIDTATGLPITPNGGDIIVSWDNGNHKIFRL